jgi:hypothetical protein
MRDGMTETVVQALQAGNVPMLVLVEMCFKSGTERVCNAANSFVWGTEIVGGTEVPKIWLGLGELGGISAIQEGTELQMYGVSLSLSGVDPVFAAKALNPEEYQQRPCTIWLALLDDDYRIIDEPVITFRGRMDTMPVEIGKTATINMTVESRLVDWERPRISRFNHEDQQALYPGDLGFEYVAQMVEANFV